MALIVLVILFLVPAAATRQKPAPAKPAMQAAAKSRPCSNQSDKQTCERGWHLRDAGEAEVSGLRESGMRAYGQLQVARAYASSDKTKAVDLLNAAFTATLGLPDGNEETVQGRIEAKEKPDLQRQTLDTLVTLSPEQAEDKLLLAVPSVREPVFAALIDHYQRNKRFDAALEMLSRIARDAAFPYMAAGRLMALLPPEKAAERQQLFTAALNSFRTHPPSRMGIGFDAGAFPNLIVQHWKGMPVGLVREAIDEVLKQADTKPEGAQPIRMTVGYGHDGSAALLSIYEYRLFQLLPVLREIDPGWAESLLRDHQAVATQFDAYVQAGSPSMRSVFAQTSGGASIRVTRSEVRGPTPGENPQDVVQRIMAVEDVGSRAAFLVATARREKAGNPETARACLDKIVDPVAAQLPSASEQVSMLADAASLYLEMKDVGDAAKAISGARAAAQKLYAADSDSSNPNKALKAYWPSTNAYIRVVRLAGRVSPNLALAIIREMPDDEIRPLLRLALAATWIGVPMGELTVIDKDGGSWQSRDPEAR